MITMKNITLLLALILFVFAGCSNSNSGKKNKTKPETIILGFELGMGKIQFYDSLQKKLDARIISEITNIYDISKNQRRFNYPLQTVNSKINILFFPENDFFYEDKLIEFTCFMFKNGTKDSLENAFSEVLDLYMIKYNEFQYQYGYESDQLVKLGINYKPKYEQPKYTWSNNNTKIEITSDLSALLKVGDHYKSTPIKNYEDIESERYHISMTIKYTNELLKNKKNNAKKEDEENIKRKRYRKADSLSNQI
jgi:hypothetical protein